ncbi:MAG TPA: lysophospholipid acyltransferase family protein [Opitutaceae bacterium]|jgi:1-acyl-sn-glycerol-3-phosphate acyltransferase|nr:lysophospholipid acyltransferase family protein [Opitutaceae bacterium]
MKRIVRAKCVVLYFLSWIVFGAVGLLLNIACMVLMLFPGRPKFGPAVRLTIRRLFKAWVAWLHATDVVVVEWNGFEGETLESGTVYIANHPTIVDATIVLARLPDAVCIFKPALMRNPAVGPAAVMAGYVRGDSGIDLLKAAAVSVANGQSLLVFPEGTRTAEGLVLGKMKPGFALIADRAKAPVRLLVIRTSSTLGRRGRPWWPAPAVIPARIQISLDRSFPYEPGRSAAELTLSVEKRICEVLGGEPA